MKKKKTKEKAGALFKFRHQYLGQFPCLTDMRSVTVLRGGACVQCSVITGS